MTECPHGFEARYIDRCALCRRAKKPATTPEIDNQRRAAGERDEDS